MKVIKNVVNYKIFSLLLCAVCCLGVECVNVAAQQDSRDPFRKPVVPTRAPRPVKSAEKKAGPTVVQAPPIQQRIDSYKAFLVTARETGRPAPKPTTVLTLDEMQVTGIFRTPRGYAAMVEATPIKLSYTIYPGEKFYDGQLVAIEESRLVFRRETRMSDGKLIVAALNKGLVQQSINEMAAPRVEQTTPTAPTPTAGATGTVSAEAVPMQSGSDPKAAAGGAAASNTNAAAAPAINTSALQPNSIKASKANNQTVDSSVPLETIDKSKSQTAPTKTKVKSNRQKNKR